MSDAAREGREAAAETRNATLPFVLGRLSSALVADLGSAIFNDLSPFIGHRPVDEMAFVVIGAVMGLLAGANDRADREAAKRCCGGGSAVIPLAAAPVAMAPAVMRAAPSPAIRCGRRRKACAEEDGGAEYDGRARKAHWKFPSVVAAAQGRLDHRTMAPPA